MHFLTARSFFPFVVLLLRMTIGGTPMTLELMLEQRHDLCGVKFKRIDLCA